MKILLIEDEVKLAEYLRKGLGEASYVVDIAYNGVDGLHMALEGSYDLLVLDAMLPGIDGFSLLTAFRKTKQTPVLMLTARISVEDRVLGLKTGADDYLVKPFAFSELRTCSKSFEQQSQKCQMDELQAGVQQPLAVLPQPPVLLQPGKAALDDPALGHHLERMQFTALGDLYRDVSTQNVLDALGKRSAHIAAVTQQGLHPAQSRFAALQCLQGTFAVRYLGCGHRNSVR